MITIKIRNILIAVILEIGFTLPNVIWDSLNNQEKSLIGGIASWIGLIIIDFIFKEKLDKKAPLPFGIIIIFFTIISMYFLMRITS